MTAKEAGPILGPVMIEAHCGLSRWSPQNIVSAACAAGDWRCMGRLAVLAVGGDCVQRQTAEGLRGSAAPADLPKLQNKYSTQ